MSEKSVEGAILLGGKTLDELLEAGPEAVRALPRRVMRLRSLEALSSEMRDELLCLAESGTVDEVWALIRSWGYTVGRSTVGRLIKKERHEAALRDREEMAGRAKALAEGKQEEVWRAGSLEALRQKMFDRALTANGEEGLKLYGELLGEEERLKRLALEERKVELQAQGLELQRARLQAEAARGNGRLSLEALRILRDEALEDRVKVARAVALLKVEGGGLRDKPEKREGGLVMIEN